MEKMCDSQCSVFFLAPILSTPGTVLPEIRRGYPDFYRKLCVLSSETSRNAFADRAFSLCESRSRLPLLERLFSPMKDWDDEATIRRCGMVLAQLAKKRKAELMQYVLTFPEHLESLLSRIDQDHATELVKEMFAVEGPVDSNAERLQLTEIMLTRYGRELHAIVERLFAGVSADRKTASWNAVMILTRSAMFQSMAIRSPYIEKIVSLGNSPSPFLASLSLQFLNAFLQRILAGRPAADSQHADSAIAPADSFVCEEQAVFNAYCDCAKNLARSLSSEEPSAGEFSGLRIDFVRSVRGMFLLNKEKMCKVLDTFGLCVALFGLFGKYPSCSCLHCIVSELFLAGLGSSSPVCLKTVPAGAITRIVVRLPVRTSPNDNGVLETRER